MEKQKRDFGSGFVGTLVKEVNIIREIPLGKDFIPPKGFEFAVDTNQYQMDNEHFCKEFSELADVEGFAILVDKVTDLAIGVDAEIVVTVNRKVYSVELPKVEEVEEVEEVEVAGDNVVAFKPRT